MHRRGLANNSKCFVFLVAALAVVKFLLAALTPFGSDFALYLSAVLVDDKTISWSPWIIWVRFIYFFWLWLPIHDNDISSLISVMLASKPNMLMPTHYLLTALVKAPLVLCDLGVGFLVYGLGRRLSSCVSTAKKGVLLWLANPFATLFVEMWGSVDVIIMMLTLLGIVWMLDGRPRLSAAAIFSGIVVRLSPVIAWLSMISWLLGRKNTRLKLLPMILAGPLGVAAYLYWSSQSQFFYNFVSFMSSTQLFSSYTPVTQIFSEYAGSELYQLFPGPGFAVTGITLYYLIAAEMFTKDKWTLVMMTLSGMLLLYGLADWFPTAYLWIMPLIAILNSAKGKYSYTLGFYTVLAVYLFAFYAMDLTTGGSSFFFVPINLVPFGHVLASAVSNASILRQQLGLGFGIRSALAGFSLVYAASVTWRILVGRRS